MCMWCGWLGGLHVVVWVCTHTVCAGLLTRLRVVLISLCACVCQIDIPYSGKIWRGLKFGNLVSSWKHRYSNLRNRSLENLCWKLANFSAIYTLFLDTLLAIIRMALRKYL